MNTLEAIYSRRSIRNFNGERITESELDEILKAAGILDIRFHDFRHTFASYAANAGIHPKTSSEIM